MSGKGAKGLAGKGAKGTMHGADKKALQDKKKPTSRSARAGLQFPVGRVHRLLKVRARAPPVNAGDPVASIAVQLGRAGAAGTPPRPRQQRGQNCTLPPRAPCPPPRPA